MDTTTTFNRQGRTVSDSMRVASFKRFLATQKPKPAYETETYRGFEISGNPGGKWYIGGNDPRVFKTKAAAHTAVDTCLALRAELAEAEA